VPDGRRANGRRYYGSASAERVALIRLCQDAGFSLAEVRAFVAAGSRRHPSWKRLMEAKLLELEASIARAKRAKALIEHGLTCRYRELSMCPNFRAALEAPHLSLPGTDSVHTGSAKRRSKPSARGWLD
jgi:DNA-binding transcriptional MerR regulator